MSLTSLSKTHGDLCRVRRGSKQWWGLARLLLNQRSKSSSIPALKSNGGEWIMEAHGKSKEFAKTFCSKFGLRPAVFNQFSHIIDSASRYGVFEKPTAACAEQVLKELRVDS
eukprot:13725975-Heterocapsa_arctica.AAC.1